MVEWGGEPGLKSVMESEGLPLCWCVRVCVPLDLFGVNILKC